MATPVWVSVTTVALGAGTTAAVAIPASTAATDMIVLTIMAEDPTLAGLLTASGFTKKYEDVVGSNGVNTVFYRRVPSSESGTYTVTWDGRSVSRQVYCYRITGAIETGDPWFGTSDLQTATGTSTVPATSIASVPASSLGLRFVATDTIGTDGTPSGWSARSGTSKVSGRSRATPGLQTLTAGATSWSASCGIINCRIAALLEQPDATDIPISEATPTLTGRGVTLGQAILMPTEP